MHGSRLKGNTFARQADRFVNANRKKAMFLDEHSSKLLFTHIGIATPPGISHFPGQLPPDTAQLPLPWFLKAQALTGGRGKAGGVLRINDVAVFRENVDKLFELEIKGNKVPYLRVEVGLPIERELYFSFTVSRDRQAILMTVGAEGGMDVESLGKQNLLTQEVRLPGKPSPHQVRAAFFKLNLPKKRFSEFAAFVEALFLGMRKHGLLMAEINPLIVNEKGFVALDGKIQIDDNHVDLNPDLETYRQPLHFTHEENVARKAGLSYVSLPGWVGIMVNGAGLAMATMDLLNHSGLHASNFLDLGGGADSERMSTALDLLFQDDGVKAVFINLFGGILSCKKVAQALESALGDGQPLKPIVARMAGNEAKEGLAILERIAGPNLRVAENMAEAIKILTDYSEDTPKPRHLSETPSPKRITPVKGYKSDAQFDIGDDTSILVQGITGREGQLHTRLMLEYGSKVVAGVTPFKGGQRVLDIPVYNSIAEAKAHHRIDASIIFVPPKMAADAVLEAAANELPWAVCITEGIPQHEMLEVLEKTRRSPTRIIGPNTPGIVIPGQTKIGIMPTQPFSSGPVAILSRSGTLTYEAAARLSADGIGQSLAVGIGGDPFIGMDFVDLLEMTRNHSKTKATLILGEIGGQAEENLAEYIVRTGYDKPVVAFVAGRTAPPGQRLGHAGAILEKDGAADAKITAMSEAGFTVCPSLDDMALAVRKALG